MPRVRLSQKERTTYITFAASEGLAERLAQAAQRLTKELDRPVSVSELCRVGAEGHLALIIKKGKKK